eukprot:15448170-Alexandrium_andersonii.AAC.1
MSGRHGQVPSPWTFASTYTQNPSVPKLSTSARMVPSACPSARTEGVGGVALRCPLFLRNAPTLAYKHSTPFVPLSRNLAIQ